MNGPALPTHSGKRRAVWRPLLCALATGSFTHPAFSQVSAEPALAATVPSWQRCAQLSGDDAARLQCFDLWAAGQSTAALPPAAAPQTRAETPLPPAVIQITTTAAHDCRDSRYSELSRFWELEMGTDCGTFSLRGYRPVSLSWIGSDSVNMQPSSPSPPNNASTAVPYGNSETRVGLSVRTKIAQGLLTQTEPLKRDSLWFAYSQQSNWQLFSGELSRPFRTTDHEPELIYLYPTDAPLPGGWRLRYAGLSLNHQSNGQPLPFSRSWNRTILMAGIERGPSLQLLGRLWARVPEDAADDDNPDIQDRIGRAEVTGVWHVNPDHTLALTLRHALSNGDSGSVKLEWLRRLGTSDGAENRSGLRLHTQLFSGYGDSLIDYNRRRVVLSVGLSLVDW